MLVPLQTLPLLTCSYVCRHIDHAGFSPSKQVRFTVTKFLRPSTTRRAGSTPHGGENGQLARGRDRCRIAVPSHKRTLPHLSPAAAWPRAAAGPAGACRPAATRPHGPAASGSIAPPARPLQSYVPKHVARFVQLPTQLQGPCHRAPTTPRQPHWREVCAGCAARCLRCKTEQQKRSPGDSRAARRTGAGCKCVKLGHESVVAPGP